MRSTITILALATCQPDPRAIAVDDLAVYWTHPGDGSVMMVVK